MTLEERAIELAADAQKEGRACFTLLTLPDGNVRIVGLSLPRTLVARMLRAAADGYEAAMKPRAVN